MSRTRDDVQLVSPLEWPVDVPRCDERKASLFFSTVDKSDHGFSTRRPRTPAEARNYVTAELDRLGADTVVIATNFDINRDGWSFRGGQRMPGDPGVAVFFDLDGNRQAIAIDVYLRAADNLWAVGRTIAAFRQIERDGGPRIMRAAISGFRQIAAISGGVSWWDILELDADVGEAEIRAAYKRLAKVRHPDASHGSADAFVILQEAMRQGLDARNPTMVS